MSVLSVDPPTYNISDAVAIAKELFGIDGSAKSLASERDQNFHITCNTGRGYVLKIANSAESPSRLECENEALNHIEQKDPDLPVPRVYVSVRGSKIEQTPTRNGRAHQVRLFSYLPGTLMASSIVDDKLLHSLGCFIGRLGAALQGFDHKAATRPGFVWNLDSIEHIQGQVEFVKNEAVRRIIEKFLGRYEGHISAKLKGLRTAVIHNDANDHNILVGKDGHSVVGVIDFGDLVRGRQINDIAVTLAYAMMKQDDPIFAACMVLTGYCSHFPLTEPELDVLLDLAIMRLATTVCVSYWRASSRPENKYLLVSQDDAMDLLCRLDKINAEFANCAFRHACGFSAVKELNRVEDWLRHKRHSTAPVLGIDFSSENISKIDFSLNSADSLATEQGAFEEVLASRLTRDKATFAIGLYHEDRAVYTTDAFKSDLDPKQRRSTHLGIDLFGTVDTPVYAPLDGDLVSAVDNAAELDYGPTIILKHETDDPNVCFYTLYGHLSRESLRDKYAGMRIVKGQKIASFGAPEVNGGWSPHLHFQIMTTLLNHKGNFPGAGEPKWMHVWRQITPDPNLVLNVLPENHIHTD